MHKKKFIDRLKWLATSPQAADLIAEQLTKEIVAGHLNHKDAMDLLRWLKESMAQKPQLKAKNKKIIEHANEYEFVESDDIGLQVKDWDKMYKRTLDWDINKLLK